MQLRKLFYLMLILPILFLSQACSDDDNGTDPVTINEAEMAAEYIEANIVYKSMITAKDLNSLILTSPNDVYIMDIRSEDAYAAGHIKNAVQVDLPDIVTHYRENNLESKTKVAMVCYSGQTAAFATAMLRMLGYTNVSDLLFGMCSWNEATASGWTDSRGNAYASQFSTESTAKNAAGELPEISTGKETAQEIIEARVLEILAGDSFGGVKITNSAVFANPSSYYIVNYWPADNYAWGHIPGAVNYTTDPSQLNYSEALNTLPTDKEVVVYCYTGQTSAHVAAYLKVLGYDAKTLLYGVNGMRYDDMPGTKFDPEVHTMGYELYR